MNRYLQEQVIYRKTEYDYGLSQITGKPIPAKPKRA